MFPGVQVKIWFQNHRYKLKKSRLGGDSSNGTDDDLELLGRHRGGGGPASSSAYRSTLLSRPHYHHHHHHLSAFENPSLAANPSFPPRLAIPSDGGETGLDYGDSYYSIDQQQPVAQPSSSYVVDSMFTPPGSQFRSVLPLSPPAQSAYYTYATPTTPATAGLGYSYFAPGPGGVAAAAATAGLDGVAAGSFEQQQQQRLGPDLGSQQLYSSSVDQSSSFQNSNGGVELMSRYW